MSRILVVGLPGSGKTTWVRENIGSGLAYDLDYLACALRCTPAHSEVFEPARQMANDFLQGYLLNAENYADDLFIIRCAPSIEEFDQIAPDVLVWCISQKVKRYCDLRHTVPRLNAIVKYANDHGCHVIEIPQAEAAGKWLAAQDRLTKQILSLGAELGLTPSARRARGLIAPK